MSTRQARKATGTALRKIKALASEMQKDNVLLPRHKALHCAAQTFGFESYDLAAYGFHAKASEPARPDDPLTERGRRLVDAVREMTNEDVDVARFLDLRYAAVLVMEEMAAVGLQQDLFRVQRELAGDVSLCRAYFDVVQTMLDIPDELRKFEHSGASLMSFDVEEWHGAAPVAEVDEGSRRRLLKRLRQECDFDCDIRVSRLAVVTHWDAKDVPGERSLFHAGRSCFHRYDRFNAISKPRPSRATMGVIAMLSVHERAGVDSDRFERLLERMGDRPYPLYEASFLDAGERKAAGRGHGPEDLSINLGDSSWSTLGDMDLPSPPGVTNEGRKEADPFVMRVSLDEPRSTAEGLRLFDVAIAAKHESSRAGSFKHIGKTQSPAYCVGWCDHFLRTIRAGGKVDQVVFTQGLQP